MKNTEEELKVNRRIWDRVWKTDKKHTKDAKVGGRKITTTNAHSQVERATNMWGPCGKAWGIRNVREEIVDVLTSEGATKIVKVKVDFYYPDLPEEGVIQDVFGSCKLAYQARKGNYTVVDDEAWKKARTDAQSKALSYLGFSADIFMGMWDDDKYHEWRKDEDKKEGRSITQLGSKQEPVQADLAQLGLECERLLEELGPKFSMREQYLVALKNNRDNLERLKQFKVSCENHINGRSASGRQRQGVKMP